MNLRMVCALLLVCLSTAFGAAVAPNRQADVVETSAGPLKITPLYHGSVMLEFGGKIIHVDPWSQADYTGLPQADLIVIGAPHKVYADIDISQPVVDIWNLRGGGVSI